MRLGIVIALIAGALTAPSPSAAQSQAADSAAVAETVRRFHEALVRGDSATAMGLLAEDAVVLEAGGVESRAEYEAHHLAADMRFAATVPSTPGPLRVRLAGEMAWATSTSDAVGSVDGRPVNSVTAELVVLSRTAGGWRIRAISWSSRRRTPS